MGYNKQTTFEFLKYFGLRSLDGLPELKEDKETKKPAANEAKDIMMRCWKRGIVIITCGKSTIRIAPPLTITRELVDSSLEIIGDVIKEVEKR